MRKVKLWDLSGAALIIPEKTGVFFTNQVNGSVCEHPSIEGILIPLNNDRFPENPDFLETLLCSLFNGSEGSISEKKANEIDALLQRFPETKGVSVNRNCIDKSVESWVHVVAKETEFSCYSGFGKINGILTWQNSD